LFTADSPTAAHWRPVDGFQELDMPRPPEPDDPTVLVVAGGLTNRADWWSTTLTLPPPPPGQVQRLLVVEHDQQHSEVDDTGPGSRRIVHVGTIDL
jgi:hypothetical protein